MTEPIYGRGQCPACKTPMAVAGIYNHARFHCKVRLEEWS